MTSNLYRTFCYSYLHKCTQIIDRYRDLSVICAMKYAIGSVNAFRFVYFRHWKARSVSSYAFLKGWLLPSPPPDCFRFSTSFPTQGIALKPYQIVRAVSLSTLNLVAQSPSACLSRWYSEFQRKWSEPCSSILIACSTPSELMRNAWTNALPL